MQSLTNGTCHVEFVFLANESRDGKGCHAASSQRIVRVDDSPVLSVANSQTGIEAGPKEPQEYRPYNL